MKKQKPRIKTLRGLIKFYESIPPNLWMKNNFGNKTKHCALGHIGMAPNVDVILKCEDLPKIHPDLFASRLLGVNDGEGSPKQNVIKYLKTLL